MKVMDTPTLERLNAKAVASQKNRSLSDEFFAKVDPDGIHVVGWSMVHNDREMRLLVLAKLEGEAKPIEVFVDVDFDDFEALEERMSDG